MDILIYFNLSKNSHKMGGKGDLIINQCLPLVGERTHADLGVPSHPVLPPEASSQAASIQSLNPQDHPNLSEPDPQSTDGTL